MTPAGFSFQRTFLRNEANWGRATGWQAPMGAWRRLGSTFRGRFYETKPIGAGRPVGRLRWRHDAGWVLLSEDVFTKRSQLGPGDRLAGSDGGMAPARVYFQRTFLRNEAN